MDLQLNEVKGTTLLSNTEKKIVIKNSNLLIKSVSLYAKYHLLRKKCHKCHKSQGYIGEAAVDVSGPRKEFLCLCRQDSEKDYFDCSLKEQLSNDHVFLGTVMALSSLQNGDITKFLSEDHLQEVLGSGQPSECLGKLRNGFNKVGIYQIANALPTFLHQFHPSPASVLSRWKLPYLFKLQFSEVRSNARTDENSTYQAFLRYVQEAASGPRESVTLSHILQFASGTDKKPPLGFSV